MHGLESFLRSYMNCTVIRQSAKKVQKLEPAFQLTLLYPKAYYNLLSY